MTRQRLSLMLVALVSLVALVGSAAWAAAKIDKVTVISGGQRHVFTVEVVDTDESRAQGLMFRRTLAPDAGMLFDYRQSVNASFWMKNTLIPLDMIFIRQDGTIANIRERAIPGDETPIPSAGPVRGVLEVNGGTVSRLGIKPGDKVENPIFK